MGKPKLRGLPRVAAQQRVSAEIIERLEELLEAARAGRVTSLAFVAREDSYTRWTASRYVSSEDMFNILGQLAALSAQIASDANSG